MKRYLHVAKPVLVVANSVMAGVLWYRARLRSRRDTELTYKPGTLANDVLAGCPSLLRYTPTWWLPGPWLNTICSSLLRADPRTRYRRVMLPVADGGVIALDWASTPQPGQPVVIFLHGTLRSISGQWGTLCLRPRAAGVGHLLRIPYARPSPA